MSRLNLRENTILFDSSGPDWGAAYRITALPIGATAPASSTGSTATVHKGHGFRAGQKFCTIASKAVVLYGTVSAVAATSLTLDTNYTISAGDELVNLGADTGSASPSYDGSPIAVWTTPDKTTAATLSSITADSTGKYRYWHQGSNFWELVRDSSLNPVHVIAGIGVAETGSVNAVDFGARPDDSTIDSGPAINAAVACIKAVTAHPSGAAGAMGGTVYLPVDDDGAYGVGTSIRITYGISLKGLGGMARMVCTTLGLDYMIGADSHNGTLGARLITIENIMLDGSNDGGSTQNAEIGFYIGRVVSGTFRNLQATNCSDAGMVVDRAQNGMWENCLLNTNGSAAATLGCGLRWENGAGNNTFHGGQLRSNTPYGEVVREAATQTAYASYFYGNGDAFGGDGPTGNEMQHTIIEDLNDANGLALVYMRTGRDNKHIGCDFSLSGQTVNKPIVILSDEDNAVSASIDPAKRSVWDKCTFNGTAAVVDAFWINDSANNKSTDCIFQNLDEIIDWDQLSGDSDGSNTFFLQNPVVISSVTDYFQHSGTRTNIDNSVYHQDFATQRLFLEASSKAIQVGTHGDGTLTTNWRINTAGLQQWGTASDASVKRAAAGVIEIADILAMGVTAGITAGTTQTQAGATALTTSVNVVSTVTVAGDGVALPTAVAGQVCVVVNADSADSMEVYPFSGDAINGLGANNPASVPAGSMLIAFASSTSQWYAHVVAVAVT